MVQAMLITPRDPPSRRTLQRKPHNTPCQQSLLLVSTLPNFDAALYPELN